MKFLADVTSLFIIVHDPLTSAEDLNHDLDLISKWAHQWKMCFNPHPTKQQIRKNVKVMITRLSTLTMSK